MPQILNRYTALDRPNYNLPLGPLSMRGLQPPKMLFGPRSFSTGMGMAPPTRLHTFNGAFGSSYVNREPLRIGYLGAGETDTATPATGAQTNTPIYTTDQVFPPEPFWTTTTGMVTLAAGGFVAGYVARCLLSKKR
jgi:hypothetical protein